MHMINTITKTFFIPENLIVEYVRAGMRNDAEVVPKGGEEFRQISWGVTVDG